MCRLTSHRSLILGVSQRSTGHVIRFVSEFSASATRHPRGCAEYAAAVSKALVPFRIYSTLVDVHHGTFFLRAQRPEDLFRLSKEAIACSSAVVSRLLERSLRERLTAKELVYAIDHISNTLCIIADPCELLRHVHPSKAWRHAANTTVEEISALISRLNIDDKVCHNGPGIRQ
ncbi:hypothetical protein X943_001375 [Babesia divergens]|uniref:Uncharacterized protein n=1 Tax=Babesia divergens TaxID=32595 RepID=A0AAD9LE09_BABDI|nr:hypothetical protein X943_001375 [Babesia divergens]